LELKYDQRVKSETEKNSCENTRKNQPLLKRIPRLLFLRTVFAWNKRGYTKGNFWVILFLSTNAAGYILHIIVFRKLPYSVNRFVAVMFNFILNFSLPYARY